MSANEPTNTEALATRLERDRQEDARYDDLIARCDRIEALLQWADQHRQLELRIERLEALLRELTGLVRGEAPQLLNEDSGGDGSLSVRIDAELESGQ